MAYLKIALVCASLVAAEADDLNPLKALQQGLQKEVVAVAHPLEAGVVGALSSQCSMVKTALGLQYEQARAGLEPDVSKLTLEFRDKVQRIIFQIMTASIELPKSRIYRPNDTLTIFVHGFNDDPTKEGFRSISDAFSKVGYFNVLALDGSSLIKWLYLRSTAYVRFMGEKLAEVLAALCENGLDHRKIHMIGHSLGAQVSGFTGKEFYRRTGKKLGRISGLDPAGPCFAELDAALHLNASDAEFVDVVHTDAGVFGVSEPVGHVDFYPNGGSKQPECIVPGCSHSRAWLYYAASVEQPQAFPAKRCANYEDFQKGACDDGVSYMGYGCSPAARGSFFLQTGGSYPFGLGDAGTKYQDNAAFVDKAFSMAKNFLF